MLWCQLEIGFDEEYITISDISRRLYEHELVKRSLLSIMCKLFYFNHLKMQTTNFFIIFVMTSKTSESAIDTAITAKEDELIRYLHILDTLAYDSLAAQLQYFEKEIRNQAPSIIKHLKWVASKKYMCFYEVKKSLLKSGDFIDINKLKISNKNKLSNLVRRSNITHFFNLLFANFDPAVPDLQKVDIKSFFKYVVPPNLMQSEKIWDQDLNLRVQIYISILNKNPQKNLCNIMFPVVIEGGPPMYKETYMKVRNIVNSCSEDVDKLTKEFKWGKFVEEMFKDLSKIINEVNKFEIPLLYKYTSDEASHIPSSSSENIAIVEDASRKEIDSNAKKRRLADIERDDFFSDNLGDSFTRREEMVQKMSTVNINGNQSVERTQSDLLLNNDGESHTFTPSRRTTRSERNNKSNSSNRSNRRATIPKRKTIERSSSSLTSMIVDQPEAVDDRRTSSEESSVERSPEVENNSRKKSKRRVVVDNSDNSDYEETTRSKRTKWTDEELDALEEGMRQYGKQWAAIKKNYGEKGQVLENRSAGQLKDKIYTTYTKNL
ncbi:hypothetical protein GLOIN_2v1589342 [Rhizophagus irregularis DAOM 181602=DAOM 197198]|nr:hypothetical protein GLOIN_2v1589342 [Rhizophagus irregularis DAOM 181602=DAOM 197198]